MEESYDRLMTRQIENSPFLDAVAVWHMDDENDSAGKNSVLSIHGDVKLGVKLEGLERKASLKRGGDGEVALFNGGYLNAEQGADGELNLSGKEMTMCIRLRVLSENWNSPLFGKYGGEEEVSYYLNCVDGSSKPFFDIVGGGGKIPTAFNDLFAEENAPKSIQGTKSLMEFVWGTEPIQEIVDGLVKRNCGDTLIDEAKKGIMRVNFPVALIESTDWHDVIVRFTGAKLELFIDGVLLDEEFPLGELRQNSAPCLIGAAFENDEIKSGFHGMIDPKVNSLGDNDSYFGVCIKASGDYEKGCELRFEPGKHRVQFGVPHEGGIGKSPNRVRQSSMLKGLHEHLISILLLRMILSM